MRKRKLYNYIFEKQPILEGYRGSIAHGLYIDPKEDEKFGTCDTDLFIIYKFPSEYYFSLEGYYKNKEVYEKQYEEIDEVGYEIRKAVHLLKGCNPNVIAWLFNRRKDYIHISEDGQKLIDNRQLFLSKRQVRDRFGGYAHSQLKRLQKGAYKGYMGEKRKAIVDEFGYDLKNAMTCIKLLRWGRELLLGGTMEVYRTKDRNMLLDIKRGHYKLRQIQKMADEGLRLLDEGYEKSVLPEKVNKHKINELLVEIIRE